MHNLAIQTIDEMPCMRRGNGFDTVGSRQASAAGNGEQSGAGKLLLSSIVYYYIDSQFFVPGLRFEVGVLEIKRRSTRGTAAPLSFAWEKHLS